MPAPSGRADWITLAWAGWSMRVPPDWRPIEINHAAGRGSMLVGDSTSAIVQVKWSVLAAGARDGFDPKRWAQRRVGRLPPAGGQKAGVPSPAGMVVLAWSPAESGPKGVTRSIWHGWSKSAGLLIEAVVYSADRPELGAMVRGEVLSSLSTRAAGDPTDWSVFDVSFRTPARFDLAERRLSPGHMAMLFAGPRQERLLLRQVYPTAAALARRDLAGWLRSEIFPQRRRFYPRGDGEPLSADCFGQRLVGLIRRGLTRYPWPFGWVGSRHTVQAAVEDPRLDRLLLVEHECRGKASDETAADAVAAMNWARFQR